MAVNDNKPGWLRGAAVDLSARMRALFTCLLALLATALCFSQFGLIAWGGDLAGGVNLALLLVPASLGVAMLGVVPGAVLALVTGVALMFRAQWSPTSYFDMYLFDPLLSVMSIAVGVACMAAIVTPAARWWRSDQRVTTSRWKRIAAPRIISLCIGCLLLALAFSYGARGAVYFAVPGMFDGHPELFEAYASSLASPDVFFEAVLNAAILSLACIASEMLDANRRAGSWESSVSSVFSRWLLLAMAMVFMMASAVSFCAETAQADGDTTETLDAELEYVQQQIAYRQAANATLDNMLDGYTAAYGGTLMVVRGGQVVAANDPELVGQPAVGSFAETEEDYAAFIDYGDRLVAYDGDELSFVVIKSRTYGSYDIIAYVPLPATYASRTSTLLYNAVFFLLLFAVVYIVARRLLRNVVVAPIHRTNDALGLITGGDLRKRVDESRVVEFASLSQGINTTVDALKDSIAEAEQRNAQELMTAKAIQESSLPRDFPPFPDIDRFDVYASMKTAKEVGGDFYDFFLIDGERLGFVMADVSGKGIPAALFMMTAKTQVRTYMESGIPVGEAIDAANHQLCLGNDAGMFVTLFACVLEYETGRLTYVNAGHNPPLVLHDGTWEWMRDVSGMPLGLFDGIPYDQLERQLDVGDMLYLYTDGVTEAMDEAGAFFGEDRLERTLCQYEGMNPRSVSVGVRRAITDFTKDCEQSDDITMLCLKYGVAPETKAVMILRADVSQLVHVFNYIHAELHRRGAPKSVRNPLDIAAEELFVNVCHYAYPDATPENPGEVRISFEYSPTPPSLTVEIADDGIPYNPLDKPDAVTPDNIDDVPIGGLGILMAKKSVDSMEYRREGGSNILTFRKGW